MSVEAQFDLDQAVDNIRNFQAELAMQTLLDIESMNYLLRTEHRIPDSLDSIARTLGEEVVRSDRLDEPYFMFTGKTALVGSAKPRMVTVATPVDIPPQSLRVEVNVARTRSWLSNRSVPAEWMWLDLHDNPRTAWDHVQVDGGTYHPSLYDNHGEQYVGIFHGFTRGVARLSGAVADAVELRQ